MFLPLSIYSSLRHVARMRSEVIQVVKKQRESGNYLLLAYLLARSVCISCGFVFLSSLSRFHRVIIIIQHARISTYTKASLHANSFSLHKFEVVVISLPAKFNFPRPCDFFLRLANDVSAITVRPANAATDALHVQRRACPTGWVNHCKKINSDIINWQKREVAETVRVNSWRWAHCSVCWKG